MRAASKADLFGYLVWGVGRIDGGGDDTSSGAATKHHRVLDAVGKEDSQDSAVRKELGLEGIAELEGLAVCLVKCPRLVSDTVDQGCPVPMKVDVFKQVVMV